MIAELRASVREQTGGRYEVLGELSHDATGSVICLARESGETSLIALALERTGTRSDGSGEYSIEVIHALDESLIAVGTTCFSCGRSSTGDTEFCPSCGADLGQVDPDPMPGLSRTEILRAVRETAGTAFEIIGEMPRSAGKASLFFAREIATGRIVALSLRREKDDTGEEYLSLGVTQVIRRPVPGQRDPSGSAVGSADGSVRESSGASASAPKFAPLSPGVPSSAAPSPATPPTSAASTPSSAAPNGRSCPVCNRSYPESTRFCPNDGSTLVSVAPDQGLVGRTLADRYHVLELIGEGGFGKVYLAEHARMGRRCALKIINPSLRNDADAVGRFSREAANASRINHPNIATVYDFGESDGGLIYLVMEYVDGETLADVLSRERPLTPERAAEIARQVCDALIAAHGLGIVHRDLKPQNILVTKAHDGSELVKVVDFGIAKAIQGEQQNITRAGLVIGTLEYMSPEQLMGTDVDGRSDIFSLGCVLYEMLTGEAAFAGPGGPVSIGRRMTEDPARVRTRNPKVPQALDEIVAMAVARDPASRFQTAEGLRDALAGVVRSSTAERLGLIRRDTGETAPAMVGPSTDAVGGDSAMEVGGGSSTSGSTAAGIPGRRPTASRAAMIGLPLLLAVTIAGVLLYRGTGGSGMSPTMESGDGQNASVSGNALLPGASGASPVMDPVTPGARDGDAASLLISEDLPPGSTVSIDGQLVMERTVALSPGEHHIRVTADGFETVDTIITVEAAQVLAWAPVLRTSESAAPPTGQSGNPAASQAGPTPGRDQTVGTTPAAATVTPTLPATAQVGAESEDAGTNRQPEAGGVEAAQSPVPPQSSDQDAAAASPARPPDAAAASPESAAPSQAELENQINDGLDRFARALESRQIANVDAAYPGMSSSERATWSGFLDGVRSLVVTLTGVDVPRVSGVSVDVPFTMSFRFTDQRGEQESVQQYRATFVRDGDGWAITAIRPD